MKVIIVGAGAAGLIAASTAAANGHNVTVIEKNHRPARKVMITGKGRCNLTNNCDEKSFIENVVRNPRFMYSCINSFGPQDIMSYIEKYGVDLKTERGNRVFPVSDKSVDIVDALYRGAKGCTFIFDKSVKEIKSSDGAFDGVTLNDGTLINGDACIICTGGATYPLTGSTGDGYVLAKQVGHTVTDIRPSLIPIELSDAFCKDLSGLSLKNVSLSVTEKQKEIYHGFGEMLFTHSGISGPIVLSASAHISNPSDCRIFIDFKPALSHDRLDERIKRDINSDKNKNVSNIICGLLPKCLVNPLLDAAEVNGSIKCNQFSKEMREKLCTTLKAFELHPTGFRPLEEGIVTRGGVNVREINPKTMESKLCKGLYFAGEVLDVDAYTGGFNLQIAFSTGYVAGSSI